MNKMGTAFWKGRAKRRRIGLVSLILAVALLISGLVTVSAAAGAFQLSVCGQNVNVKDGLVELSTTESRNFRMDNIFTYNAPASSGWWGPSTSRPTDGKFTNVKAIVIQSAEINDSSAVQFRFEEEKNDTKVWTIYTGRSSESGVGKDNGTSYTYKVPISGSLSGGTFNDLMGKFDIYFDATKSEKPTATATVTVTAYSSTNVSKSSVIGTYTCAFRFYTYAEGAVDTSSVDVDYKNEFAQTYDQSYRQIAPDGVDANLTVSPADEDCGKVEFDMHISDKGSGAKQVKVGYQYKISSVPWTDEIPIYYPEDVDVIELSSWNINTPIHMTVEGLDAGTQYDVRGVLQTDGKSQLKYTDSVSVRYNKPIINSFNTGTTGKVYRAGANVNMSMLSVFNDANSVGKTYQDDTDSTHTGPALRADIYFTPELNLNETVEDGGTQSVTRDNSKWYRIPSLTETQDLQDENGKVSNSFSIQGKTWRLPSTLADLGVDGSTEHINSDGCALKLVVTDLRTGYAVYSYSDPFTIDSSAPENLQVIGADNLSLDLEDEAVVGGNNAQVKIDIGGATDIGGSGIKEYRYAMYYLGTNAVTDQIGTTREQVLNTLASYTPQSYTGKYTDWTVASPAYEMDGSGNLVERENWSQLTVAQDGYYRVDAIAVDNADYQSEVIQAYFQVDLTLPSTPEVYLAQRTSGTGTSSVFEPYDNRTYTETTVWLFARSEPKTGKTISYFEYSTDGGLTWLRADAAAEQFTDFNNTTKTVPVYADDKCTTTKDFTYQIGVNLTAQGLRDYKSILVRVTDNLGNVSLVSNPVVMRIMPSAITTTATMSHDPIEVALAMGNIDGLNTDDITPDLKNAAAKKINKKYYGESGSATMGAANFNPYLYVKDHDCSWGADASCSGPCILSGCPYATLEANGYSIYKPEIVNVQGMSNGDATVGMDWYHFDHSNSTANQGLVTKYGTLKGLAPTNEPTRYYNSEYSIYTAANSYVISTSVNSGSNESNLSSVGSFNGTVMNRILHVVPFESTTASTQDLNREGKSDFAIKNIRTYGYHTASLKDWMFAYNDQSAKKNIAFSIDDAKIYTHSNDGYGFMFNTTQRQKKNGSWVISGYMFYIYNNVNPGGAGAAYSWALVTMNEVPMTTLMDASGSSNLGADIINNNQSGFKLVQRIDSGLYGSTAVRHFRLVCSGNTTKIYCWQEGKTSSQTAATLEAKFNADTNYGKTDGKSSYTDGFRAIPFSSGTTLNTPRPKVDGETIGQVGTGAAVIHKDTNCYGFGIITGCNSHGHDCTSDTQIIFSNIIMKITNVRKLSEVVTEPSWGDGKAKFILNLSDDAVSDFKDPILTAQIQWRLNNDKARYIGWGKLSNQAETISFLKRMAGSDANQLELDRIGMYEYYDVSGRPYTTQVDNIATYITNQYYDAFGFDVSAGSAPIQEQIVSGGGVKKGVAYTMDDVDNLLFTVNPPEYAQTSANPDYPAGRWYMVHDALGMGNEVDVRSGKYSDALDTNVTLPGRYSFYFAPSKEDIENDTLDPKTAVFDFVVNQRPEAAFVATASPAVYTNVGTGENISTYQVTITNAAYDPDCPSGPVFTDNPVILEDGTVGTETVQVSGIVKTEWRYEMLRQIKKTTSEGTVTDLEVVVSTNWSTNSVDGKTFYELTNGAYATLPDNAVLTIYQRVTDVATARSVLRDSNGAFVGYQYLPVGGAMSYVCQNNVTTSGSLDITYTPQSAMSLSSVNMYNTADQATSESNKNITVTRMSTHPQDKKIALSWEIDLGSKYKLPSRSDTYVPLSLKEGTNDYYTSFEPDIPALKCVQAPTVNGTLGDGTTEASTDGVWTISYEFISKYVSPGNSMGLKIIETAYGLSAVDAASSNPSDHTKMTYIKDHSARTIYYRVDDIAPTAQIVTMGSVSNGQDGEYEASNYLDVTAGDKFVTIHVDGSVDSQGALAGYGYYFYDKDIYGHPTAYYYMDANGNLVQAASAAEAVAQNAMQIGPDGGDITIGKNAMGSHIPTYSVNVAVFAYDTRTDNTNSLTGGNETALTRIEDIKLSQSIPMPPEIAVTNTMNQNVAHIDNEGGFKYDDSGNANTAVDKPYSDPALNFYSSTDVSLQFIPEKDTYSMDANGQLQPDPNGSEYYEDIYRRADLTGTADVQYTIEYRQDSNDSYEAYSMGGTKLEDVVMPSARTLTLSDIGQYRVTAQIMNGAGSVSDERQVEYYIDKDPPTPMTISVVNSADGSNYNGGWVRSVTLYISGSTDANTASSYYYVSTDGGRTWDEAKKCNIASTLEYPITKTGDYTVKVKAVDGAGNEQTMASVNGDALSSRTITVRVDATAPDTPGPTLTASSTTVPVYQTCVVSLDYEGGNGSIQAMVDGVLNTQDREVAIPTGESARFYFFPKTGKTLGTVVSAGRPVAMDELRYDNTLQAYYLEVSDINTDFVLSALFPDAAASSSVFRFQSTGISFLRSMARGLNSAMTMSADDDVTDPDPETPDPDPEIPDPDPVVTHQVFVNYDSHGVASPEGYTEVQENDSFTVTITPDRGCEVDYVTVNGAQVPLESLESAGENSRAWLYTIEHVDQDLIILVGFREMETRPLKLSYSDCGTAELMVTDDILDEGNGLYYVPVGQDVTLLMSPQSDQYVVSSLTIDGVEVGTNMQGTSIPYVLTVPAYTGSGEDEGIQVDVQFEVSSTVMSRIYRTAVGLSDDGAEHGTISPIGENVRVPVNGSRTFRIKPEAGYYVSKLTLVTEQTSGGEVIDSEEHDVLDALVTLPNGEFSYTLENPTMGGSLEVTFSRIVYWISLENRTGGEVSVARADGEGFNMNRIPQGTPMVITVKPKDGYRVKNLRLTYYSNGSNVVADVGAVRTFALDGIYNNITIRPEFELREVTRLRSTHAITAVANNVKDAHDALHATPYRFRITGGGVDGVWSEWSASNTITYTGVPVMSGGMLTEIPLKANIQYTVYVQTRDRVGNQSGTTSAKSQVYTLANSPATIAAEAVDSKGDVSTKSVDLYVDSNGNAADTEYLVYYSTSASMNPIQSAKDDNNQPAWATLKDGKYTINGLMPGVKYYLQVVARNHDGKSTPLNNNDILSILLSPASPPANSLYFEEPETPVSPIILHWTAPAGDVTDIEIYRDGMALATVPATELSYTDPRSNFAGDHVAVYSYAYVNSAGAGSSQTAISEELFDAVNAPSTDTVATKKYVDMLQLCQNYSCDLFAETMTYPVYPPTVSVGRDISASAVDTDNSGQITVTMVKDSSMDRNQKYFLTLKAYEVTRGEDKEVVSAQLVPDSDWQLWDSTGAYHNVDGTQIPVETKSPNTNGAVASWKNLNTRYEYQIYVQEIRSVGRKQSGDSYTGQTQGIEAYLGKTYYVTKDKFGYFYTAASANAIPLNTGESNWNATDLQQYTYGLGWDHAIHEGYIAFNKSPDVKLAGASDVYTGNSTEQMKTDSSGQPYVLVDQSMEDQTFTVKVAAWDQDGAKPDSSPYVKAKLVGQKAEASTGALTAPMPVTELAAMRSENLYELTFDVRSLPTGIYTDIELQAFDGDTTKTVTLTNAIRLVVNHTTPSVSTNNTGVRKLEQELSYAKSGLEYTAQVPESNNANVQAQVNSVRLLVMSQEYQRLFGADTVAGLTSRLCNTATKNTSAYNNALAVLGSDASNSAYVSGGVLTQAGLQKMIAKVAPPVTSYFMIDEAQYNTLAANAATKDKVRKESNPLATYYWVETEYALNNGLCSWLTKDGSDKVKVTGTLNETYYAELVASFGGNRSTRMITTQVLPAPFAKIVTNQSFGWEETDIDEEYQAYETMTVQEVIDRFQGCNYVDPELDGSELTAPAAKTTDDGKKWIFTLSDDKALITNNWISGNLEMNLGVYSHLDELKVYFATDQSFNPNTDPIPSDMLSCNATHSLTSSTNYNRNGLYSFSANGLKPNTTYYLWSGYVIRNEDGSIARQTYSEGFVALTTTTSYAVSYYGFGVHEYRYAEADYSELSGDISIPATRQGSEYTSARLGFTLEYFQADEFGTMLTDEQGEPIPITGQELEWAKETLCFTNGTTRYEVVTSQGVNGSRVPVNLQLKDTENQQGHMIVRLWIEVVDRLTNYTRLQNGNEYTDIFVQDDESPIQTFKLGIYNQDENGDPILKEVTNDGTPYFEYKMQGLPVDYFNGMENLSIFYQNIGTGTLENITATIYTDKAGTSISEEFELVLPPTENVLTPDMGDRMGQIIVAASTGLDDNVHEAWLHLRAGNMEESDTIKIHLIQVVGQSTVQGRIYITAEEPSETTRMGISRVLLYDAERTGGSADAVYSDETLMYSTETDQFGYYTIPNVENNHNYFLVVERDGFVTYNSPYVLRRTVRNGASLKIPEKQSGVYTFNLSLRGGDIDRNQKVEMADLTSMIQHYNAYYDRNATELDEYDAITKRCDFNGDGVVNALDRIYLIGNIGITVNSYAYAEIQPDP